MEHSVKHNKQHNRFEITEKGSTAVLTYKLSNNIIDMQHTIVPEEMEGKGVGSALVKQALNYARHEEMKVKPTCPFIKAYIDRHPEYKDLVS